MPPSFTVNKLILGILILATLMLISYNRVLTSGFVWDDERCVIKNDNLKTHDGLARIWFKPDATDQYYPLTSTVFWTGYQLWGLNPLGYHLTNLFLHLINAILVWLILGRLSVRGGFLAALIFAVHPVHVESVAWVTELKNVLSVTFYLLSLWMYFRFFDDHRWTSYALALLLFIGALLSKTVVCTLPVALLIILWWKKGRLDRHDILSVLPFFVIGGGFGLFTAWFEKATVGAKGAYWDLSFLERSLIAARALWFYPAQLLWPVDLKFFYPRWIIHAHKFSTYLPLAGFMGLGLWIGLCRPKIPRGVIAALLFFVITIFPALGFFNIYFMRYSFVADHFQYLASLGLIVLAAYTIVSVSAKINKQIAYGLQGVLVFSLMMLTFAQTAIYKDEISIYTHILKDNPFSELAYNNRGVAYEAQQQYDLALADYKKALEIDPQFIEAYNNRALVYEQLGQYDLAIADYNKILKMKPIYEVHYNRGNVYVKLGQDDLAIIDYTQAIHLNNRAFDAYNNRAAIYGRHGQYELAIADYTRALDLRPDPLVFRNRQLVYQLMQESLGEK